MIKNFKLFLESVIADKENKITKGKFVSYVKTDVINYQLHPDLLKEVLSWKNIYRSRIKDSLSFYDRKRNGKFILDGTLRLSDHWSLEKDTEALTYSTDIDVSFWENKYFTLARFDNSKKIWHVLQTYPKQNYKQAIEKLLFHIVVEYGKKKDKIKEEMIFDICKNNDLTISLDKVKYFIKNIKDNSLGFTLKQGEIPNLSTYRQLFRSDKIPLKLVWKNQIMTLNKTQFFDFLDKQAKNILDNTEN